MYDEKSRSGKPNFYHPTITINLISVIMEDKHGKDWCSLMRCFSFLLIGPSKSISDAHLALAKLRVNVFLFPSLEGRVMLNFIVFLAIL